VRPCWINLVLLLNSGLGELQVRLLNIWEWSENVFFNHGHDIVKMWDYQAYHCFLILQQLLDFINCIKTFGLALDILGLIFVVVVLLANEQLLLEALFSDLIGCASTCSVSWFSTAHCGSGFA
jgi:hypothetical protein